MNKNECLATVHSLLYSLNRTDYLSSSALKRFFELEECDKYLKNAKSKKELRENIKEYIDELYTENNTTRDKVSNTLRKKTETRAVFHFKGEIEYECANSLTFSQKLFYRFMFKHCYP